jgi:hypothetical protein
VLDTGNTEWTGDWSDHSPLWTDELKREFGWTDADDGTFWMEVKDFIRCVRVHVCD